MKNVHIPPGILGGLGLPDYSEWIVGIAEGERLLTELAMHTGKGREELLAIFKRTDLSFEQFHRIVMQRFSLGLNPFGEFEDVQK